MKIVTQVKLLPSPEQHQVLIRTIEACNAACNRISPLALSEGEFGKFRMHRRFYHLVRKEFGISAGMATRVLAKVDEAYKLSKACVRRFRKRGSIPYCTRILSFDLRNQTVSIWTMGGRIKVPFTGDAEQLKRLALTRGQSDLVYRYGKWLLHVVVEVQESGAVAVRDWLGVDLGLTNIAASSDGRVFGDSRKVAGIRDRRFRQRRRLQRKGTRSAKRVLRRLSGREGRFSGQVNHEISKQIVAEAKRTERGIALEDLTHIHDRIRANRKQMRRLHSWAFEDLQSKISYKAKLIGIPVKFIDPRNTSRTCPKCGHVDKQNRKTQAHFECVSCGYTANADTNAAENIRRAAIGQPHEPKGVRVQAQ